MFDQIMTGGYKELYDWAPPCKSNVMLNRLRFRKWDMIKHTTYIYKGICIGMRRYHVFSRVTRLG
jgi:hypothetical protein